MVLDDSKKKLGASSNTIFYDYFSVLFTVQCTVGCPSKLVLIRNNRNWNRNLFWHYPEHNVCFGCFGSIPKQRVSMFRLNQNKQKTNRNSLIGSIFCNFYRKFMVFSVFSVCFETVCFGASIVSLL
jgi:hypothetical protein